MIQSFNDGYFNHYIGTSADGKPSGVPENSLFSETDTQKEYQYMSGKWQYFRAIKPEPYINGVKVAGSELVASDGKVDIPSATTSKKGVVKKGSAVSDSTATDVETLVTDFNGLLASLRSAGII